MGRTTPTRETFRGREQGAEGGISIGLVTKHDGGVALMAQRQDPWGSPGLGPG